MALNAEMPGPYAPASAVLETLDRYRNRGLATPITPEVLQRIGVSESLSPRTFYALHILDLIDSDGTPTQTLEALRTVPASEYQERLGDWLRAAYAEVFLFVDPSVDDETRIRDAFRNYRPYAQQNRMVTLFTGLCTAAGIMPAKSKQPRAGVARPARRPAADSGASGRRKPSGTATATATSGSGALPPALAGLLASLPPDGRWTKDRRDKFVITFESVLDYSFAIVKPEAVKDKENGGT